MAAEIAEPCIKYDDEFEASNMTQVKLETTGGAPVRSRKAPVFSAKFGVEGLFHVIDKYTAVATQLNYTTAEKFTHFEEVLDTQAAKKWNTIIRPIVGNQRNWSVDPATNLVELIRVNHKTAEHVQQQFQNCWLSRYPWPKKCVHDNGGEFTGEALLELMRKANTRDSPTTSRAPTANAICERMHQTVGNVLRTLLRGHPPANVDDEF